MRQRILLITGLVALLLLGNPNGAYAGEDYKHSGKKLYERAAGATSSNFFFLTLNSLADLKKYKPVSDGQFVTITYKLVSTDNSGGQFEWDATSTATPDDAIVVQSSVVSTGRWKRVITSNKYYARWWSPVASGADQSALLNKMILSLPSSATLEFDANKIYNINSQVILVRPITVNGNNTTLVYKGPTTKILSIRSSYITVTALNVTGDLVEYAGEGFAIAVEKGTNDRFHTDIIVQNCVVKNYKHTGIWMRYAKNFKILNNTITNMAYGGIIVNTCVSGVISNNTVSQITARLTPNGNAYGIAITLGKAGETISSNILVSTNTVRDCPWEGIDTHGAKDITFSDNKVYGCNTGIAVVNFASDGLRSPKNIIVKNNYVEHLKNPTGPAITFSGVDASDPATGLISYNTCKGHGIKINRTKGVIITGNTILQPNQSQGIALKEYNSLATITLNKITDVWDAASNNTAAVKYLLGNNDAYMDGNVLSAGTFIPPSGSKNNFGFRPNVIDATNKAIMGSNNFSAAKKEQYSNATCATFNVNAGAIKTVSDVNYSIPSGIKYIVYSVLTTTKTLTIPSASSYPNRILYIRHAGSGTVTLALSTPVKKTSTISITSLTFKNQVSLISDGKYWWTLTQNF